MDSLKDLWNSLTTLFKDELRLYTLKGVEKSSLFLGLIASIFIVSIFCLLVFVFGSVALANFINFKLDSDFFGYSIVSGGYLIILILMLIWMLRRKKPLLTNIFIKSLISIFNIPEDEDNKPEKPENGNGTHSVQSTDG